MAAAAHRRGFLAKVVRLAGGWRRLAVVFAVLLAFFLVAGFLVAAYLDRIVTRKMDGRRWNLPTRLYSDAWVIRPGDSLGPDDVERLLHSLRYGASPAGTPVESGRYLVQPGRLTVGLRDRESPWGTTPGFRVRLEFSGRRVTAVKRADDGAALPWAALEPEVVGSVFDEKMEDRTLVRLAQVPKVVLDAILTTEDRDFWTHRGISPWRVAGAMLRNLTRRSGAMQGGSTLTQQLVKNFFLTPERTLRRKAVEAALALIVEARYGKEEILEAYLNEIYLGQRGSVSVTGVEEGARFYFGKAVSALELPEAAMLAGLISSPGRYSPFRNPENARARRAFVLKAMRETGKIDDEALRKALEAPLTSVAKPATGIQAPHFVDFVLSQLKESRATLSQEGMSVFTTLDPEMQTAAQAAVQKGLEDLEKKFKRLRPREGTEPLQAALIALDPATGSVRALVGGRDYGTSQFNRVTQAKRQPGSLFKPYVYLAGLSKKELTPRLTAATILQDSPITLLFGKEEGDTYSPRNYDSEFHGPVTVRQALEGSRNIPTVRIAVTETTPGKTLLTDIVETAKRFGITSPLKPYPSLALGAFETTPMEIAVAYAPFANGGWKVAPDALLGWMGAAGRTAVAHERPLVRVADPEPLQVLVSMLQGVVDRGTGGSARRLGAQGIFAGKTGTTNDGRDAWFIGFSPRLLVAVWLGFDDNRGLNLSGSMAAVPIYAEFARRLPAHYFEDSFPQSPGVVGATIDPATGYLVTEDCPTSFNEVFVAGTEPKERCPVHRGYAAGGGGGGSSEPGLLP